MKHKITIIPCSTNALLRHPAELKLFCMVRLELILHSCSTLTSQPVSVLTLCTEPTNCCRVREMSHQIFCSNLKQVFCWSANYSKIIAKQTPKIKFRKEMFWQRTLSPHPHLTADNSTKEITPINFRLVNNKVSRYFRYSYSQALFVQSDCWDWFSAQPLPHLWHCHHQSSRWSLVFPLKNSGRWIILLSTTNSLLT